jgi:hypothetical protein
MIAEWMLWPGPTGFQGPMGTREVHTEVFSLNMTGGSPVMAVRAGPGGAVTRTSPGEVESLNMGGDFPAESYFRVFTEVDLPPAALFPGATVWNTLRPLIVKNASIDSLPPKVVYLHEENFAAPPVYFKTFNPGDPWTPANSRFGFLVLAGHGLDFSVSPARDDYDDFDSIMSEQEEMWFPIPDLPCPWPDEPGYDTIGYSLAQIDLYSPEDPNLHIGGIVAGGETVVMRGPYDAGLGYIETEMVQMSLTGYSEHLGGDFEIELNPDFVSIGHIWPCDTTCEYASSDFLVSYIIQDPTGEPIAFGEGDMTLVNPCDPGTGWNPIGPDGFRPPWKKYYEDPRKVPIYDIYGNLIGYIWKRHWVFRPGVYDFIPPTSNVTYSWYEDGEQIESEWFYGYRLMSSPQRNYESHSGFLDFREKHPEYNGEAVEFVFFYPPTANGWRQTIVHPNGVSDVYAYNAPENVNADGPWAIPDLLPAMPGHSSETIFTAVDLSLYNDHNPDGFVGGEWEDGQTITQLGVNITDGQVEDVEGIYWARSEFIVGDGRSIPIPSGGEEDLLNSQVYPVDLLIAGIHANHGFTNAAGCCQVAGDANDDGNLDVGDAVFLINFIFKNGTAPVCGKAADANNDCDVDVGDAVYIVHHIFKDGPAPDCGCAE